MSVLRAARAVRPSLRQERALSLFGAGGGDTAKAAAAAARSAGSEAPGLEIPWQQGKIVFRKLLR